MSSDLCDLSLIKKIEDTGFNCIRCGTCCKENEPGSNIVMIGPEEVRKIMEGTGLSFQEIVRPYPDMINHSGSEYTFGWMIRHSGDHCMFLEDDHCKIYKFRPWICRTYPFMLTENGMEVFPCNGIGKCLKSENSNMIAEYLIQRQAYEKSQEDRIRLILNSNIIPTDRPVVIDEEGIKDYYG
jgi:uncharacterized protein